MKNFLLSIIALFILSSGVEAESLSFKQILESTCRVMAIEKNDDINLGTGTVIGRADGNYYVLTNGHVVENHKSVTLEFFTGGQKTIPINANVVWERYVEKTKIDFAILSFSDKAIKNWSPRIIKTVSKNQSVDLRSGKYIMSAGCPEGRWPMAYEGSILGLTKEDNDIIKFTPPPTGGQSGSAIFADVLNSSGEYETRVVAIVTWRIGHTFAVGYSGYDIDEGGAISINALHDARDGRVSFGKEKMVPYLTVQEHLSKALGADGKHYNVYTDENGEYQAEGLPKDVRIIRWPKEARTPPGRNYGYGANPYKFGNNNGHDYHVPDLDKIFDNEDDSHTTPIPTPPIIIPPDNSNEIEQLKKEKIELEKQIEDLNKQIFSLEDSNDSYENEIRRLNKEIEKKESQISSIQNNLKEVSSRIEEVESEAQEKILEVRAESETTIQNFSFQRNVLGTIVGLMTTGGVLSLLAWIYGYKFGGRKRIKDKLDNIEDKVEDKVSNIIGDDAAEQLRKKIDDLEKAIGDKVFGKEEESNLKVVIEGLMKIIQENPPMNPRFNHPDFAVPPGPVYPQAGQIYIPTSQNAPIRPYGLGPVPPEYPARMHSSHEIISNLEDIVSKHPEYQSVLDLLRQHLNSPMRPKTI